MLSLLVGLALAANDFAGAGQCGKCHAAQFEKQRRSHHAASLAPILKSSLPEKLAGHTVREKNGLEFDYSSAPNGIAVTARRGGEQAIATLEWAFGAGAQGITPVGKINGRYFEHRVSWYTRESRAGLTIGHHADPPLAIAAALGQTQSAETIERCFRCHATGVKSGPDLSTLRPGVECERCHGPGKLHAERPSAASIVNPGRLAARALVESCGECHRLPGPDTNSPESVRFAPVGLMASRCFQASGKLSCLTCHDPHEDARHEAQFYTEKCLGCHAAATASSSPQCRRASRENCLPCHMPKSSPIPFLEFTDHRIRVVKAVAPVSWEPVERAIAAGDFEGARRLLDAMPPGGARSRLLASKIYDGLNDPAKAVSEAQAAIELDPRNVAAYIQLGQIFLAHNTPQPAVEIFTDALRIAPDSLLARLGRGLAWKDLQRYDEAEQELAACLNRNPRMGIAFDSLSSMYLQTSDSRKLADLSQRYIETNPADYRGYYYLAAAKEHEKQDSKGAEELIRRSLELDPNFAASHALLGKLLTQENRLEEAVKALERAVALRADYPPAHLYLGGAYRKLGRGADAEREFQILRELNEKKRPQPSLLYHRGDRK